MLITCLILIVNLIVLLNLCVISLNLRLDNIIFAICVGVIILDTCEINIL